MLTQMLGNIADDHILPVTSSTYTSLPQQRSSLSHAAIPPTHFSLESEPWATMQSSQNGAPLSRPPSSLYQNQSEAPVDLPIILPDASVRQVSPANNPPYAQLSGARETAPLFLTRSTSFLHTIPQHQQQHPHQFASGLGPSPPVHTAKSIVSSTPHGFTNSNESTMKRIKEVYQNVSRPYDYTQVS